MEKNNTNIKLRKNLIKISFLEGQITKLNYQNNSYLEKNILYLNKIYEEKLEKLNYILHTKDKNEIKRNKLFKKLEQRQYWQKRRYKQKFRNNENLEMILKEQQTKHANNLKSYKNILLSKYPIVAFEEKIKEKTSFKIQNLNLWKDQKMQLIQKSNNKLINKNNLLIQNLNSSLDKLRLLDQQLKKQISLEKENALNQNKIKLENVEEKIKLIEDELINTPDNDQLKKELVKVNHEKERIDTYIKILESENIHLSVSNLKMYFGGIKALDGVSFDVREGEIFGLIGPNGAGKTTVFNCITQFYKPTAGEILFKNKENGISNLNQIKTHNIVDEGIARSFQNIEMIWELSILDNLLVAAHSIIMSDFLSHTIHTKKMKDEEEVLRIKGFEILKMLEISEYAYRSPYGLPYGILKKVELARTLMTNPKMIILDEPAAGLNDLETKELGLMIKKINKELKVTIFLVEHDMQLVMSICDTVLAINFGKMLAIGTPKDIQNNESVKTAYLGVDEDE